MCIVSFYLFSKVFVIPSFGNISREQSQILEIDKKLYDILSKVDMFGRAWYLPIEKKKEVLELRSEENECLYDSIGSTEVVRKGFGGNMRPVGKYADYLDEIEAIGKEGALL